jgi:hypothetical protein
MLTYVFTFLDNISLPVAFKLLIVLIVHVNSAIYLYIPTLFKVSLSAAENVPDILSDFICSFLDQWYVITVIYNKLFYCSEVCMPYQEELFHLV